MISSSDDRSIRCIMGKVRFMCMESHYCKIAFSLRHLIPEVGDMHFLIAWKW